MLLLLSISTLAAFIAQVHSQGTGNVCQCSQLQTCVGDKKVERTLVKAQCYQQCSGTSGVSQGIVNCFSQKDETKVTQGEQMEQCIWQAKNVCTGSFGPSFFSSLRRFKRHHGGGGGRFGDFGGGGRRGGGGGGGGRPGFGSGRDGGGRGFGGSRGRFGDENYSENLQTFKECVHDCVRQADGSDRDRGRELFSQCFRGGGGFGGNTGGGNGVDNNFRDRSRSRSSSSRSSTNPYSRGTDFRSSRGASRSFDSRGPRVKRRGGHHGHHGARDTLECAQQNGCNACGDFSNGGFSDVYSQCIQPNEATFRQAHTTFCNCLNQNGESLDCTNDGF